MIQYVNWTEDPLFDVVVVLDILTKEEKLGVALALVNLAAILGWMLDVL